MNLYNENPLGETVVSVTPLDLKVMVYPLEDVAVVSVSETEKVKIEPVTVTYGAVQVIPSELVVLATESRATATNNPPPYVTEVHV